MAQLKSRLIVLSLPALLLGGAACNNTKYPGDPADHRFGHWEVTDQSPQFGSFSLPSDSSAAYLVNPARALSDSVRHNGIYYDQYVQNDSMSVCLAYIPDHGFMISFDRSIPTEVNPELLNAVVTGGHYDPTPPHETGIKPGVATTITLRRSAGFENRYNVVESARLDSIVSACGSDSKPLRFLCTTPGDSDGTRQTYLFTIDAARFKEALHACRELSVNRRR